MNFIFKHFAHRIVIDMYPSKFTFSVQGQDINISFAPFIYIETEDTEWVPIALGEEIPDEIRTQSNIYRIDIKDFNKNSPLSSTLGSQAFLKILFEYGIGKCFEKFRIPQLRPVVFVLGADRFTKQFEKPRDVFDKALRNGGAKIVIFDKTEL